MTQSVAVPLKTDLALQVLRALVAVGIFANHWSEPYFPQLIPQQQLTIDIFFFIEGLLAGQLASEVEGNTGIDRPIIERFRVVYPIYVVGLIAGSIAVAPSVLAGTERWSLDTFTAAFGLGLVLQPTFSQAVAGSVFPLNPPSWAIVLELWGFTGFWLLRRRLTLGVLAVATGASLMAMISLALHWYNTNMGWQAAAYWGGVPRMLFGFLGGALIYKTIQTYGAILPRLSPVWIWVGAVLILFVKVRLIGLPLLVLGVPLIVWLGAVSSEPRRLLPLGREAGRLAYGIYLMGYPTMLAIRAAGDHLGIPASMMGGVLGFLAALSILIIVASLVTGAMGKLDRLSLRVPST